jgi:hypothetical protein
MNEEFEGLRTLAAILDAVGASSDVPGQRQADGTTTWSGAIGPFVVLAADGRSVDFRLDPNMADGATRTQDATTSERGPGWVTFTPLDLDGHAIDQVIDWFAAAARHSGN